MTVNEKVKALRKLMREQGIDCWYVNGTDPHQSEYVCPRWRSRAWLSGFTGSAGTVIVTKKEALLWVDSRYFIQGAKQIEGSCFNLMKLDWEQTPSPVDWLLTTQKKGTVVSIAADTLSLTVQKQFEDAFAPKGLELKPVSDLLDQIWTDRPAVPFSTLVQMDKSIAGFSRSEKFAQVRAKMKEEGCSYTMLCSLDDIAWVTNLRGDDVAYNPVFLSYLLIGQTQSWLFTEPKRFSPLLAREVAPDMEVLPYEVAAKVIAKVVKARDVVAVNPDRTNVVIAEALGKAKHLYGRDVTTDMKAQKNPVEMDGMRKSHLLDGVALVNFLASLDTGNPHYDEWELSQMLKKERLRAKDCIGESFSPIAAFSENGAMCHYSATEKEKRKVEGSGLLVLDTGGMYIYGMTDVTRTVAFGTPTKEEITDYTLVLQGHLALAAAVFPEGTFGYQLDVLAKEFMWKHGMTFYHGTGHGVGFRLNVHEGPQNIGWRPITVPLKPGMVTSDEPGIYKEGRHGIRIENLIAVQEAMKTEFGQFLQFETLTLCPYERKLIDKSMLTEDEIKQVDGYHARVYAELKDLVDPSSRAYLKEATKPL
jgi:Xaa-Pro aminopeptidase